MKWEPFHWQEATKLLKQAERIQRNFLQVLAVAQDFASPRGAAMWVPPVNVIETAEVWRVISALPGVEPEKIQLRLEGNELIIAGTRPLPPCDCQGELKVWEIPLGRFERRVALPAGARLTVAATRFEDGMFIAELKKVS